MTDKGIGKSDGLTLSTAIVICVFIGIALYNVIELNFIIVVTFKRYQGLYFTSFLVSTWGIALYATGFLLKGIQVPINPIFFVTLIIIGWIAMVTGQSIVLYSRLHLVLRDLHQLRLVLIMIIVNAFICHTPIIVMIYGAESSSPEPYLQPYTIYEKIQVTIFFIQELIISGLYIIHTIRVLQPQGNLRSKPSRRVMTHLIWVNVFIVVLDITILGLEYAGLYVIQTAYKALVYSVKLKLEFSILSQLVELTQRTRLPSDEGHSTSENMQMGSFGRARNPMAPRRGSGLDTSGLEVQEVEFVTESKGWAR